MDDLLAELLAELKIELGVSDDDDVAVLTIKIKSAAREITQIRNYPSTYTDEVILADLTKYYTNIKKVATYDYNQVGVEFQDSHSENGVGRGYMDRKECFIGIKSFVTLI